MTNMITSRTPALLALAFSFQLREALSAEEMAQVLKTNAKYRDRGHMGICASHDFCDANMVMEAAFRMIGMEVFTADVEQGTDGTISDDTTALWNSAWDLAKASDFSVPKYMTEFPTYGPDLGFNLPPGWDDTSWHNDACPSFRCGDYCMFVDYAKPEEREGAFDGRYTVYQHAPDGEPGDILLNTDTAWEVRTFVTLIALRVEIEDWREAMGGEREGLDELCEYADGAINKE